MSVKQMAIVWELDLAPNQRLVLLAYADHADEEGNNVYPSLGRIAHKTGYSRDQVRRISKQLVADELMELITPARHNRGAEYRLTLWRGSKLPPLAPRGVGANDPSPVGAPVQPEPSVEPSLNDTPNGVSANGEQEKPVSPMPMGQFGVKELAERVKAAGERGATIHSPTDRERRDFGAQFKQASLDGYELENMLYALDYMVAKAAGELGGEPKAWCGYRTALDRVLEGWRPKARLKAVRDPEHERMVEENARLEAELIEEALRGAS